MIAESMTIQGLHVISLALTPGERWAASRVPFDTESTTIAWLTAFATLALIISVVLLCWVFSKHRQTEHRLNLQIAELLFTNEQLREKTEQLSATNEKLTQENTVLRQKQVEILENVVQAETPGK